MATQKVIYLKTKKGFVSAWVKETKNVITIKIYENQNPFNTKETLIESLNCGRDST